MIDWLTASALGVVEGITEFLPVSSTGHLLIAQHWLPQQSDLYNVVIQTGAVLAVIPLFHQRFHQFIFKWRDPMTRDYLIKIIVAFVITGIGGLIIDKKGLKLPETFSPVAVALLIGGIVFIAVENMLRRRSGGPEPSGASSIVAVSWIIVIAVGVGQLIAAVFPGASRSGTTIMLAMILGLARPLATEFSFLVSIPTMLAAGGYKIFKELHHPASSVPENWQMVIVTSVIAAVVSFIAVKWLLRFVQTHTFIGFGWYRIVVGTLILVALFTHVLSDKRKDDAPQNKNKKTAYFLFNDARLSAGETVARPNC